MPIDKRLILLAEAKQSCLNWGCRKAHSETEVQMQKLSTKLAVLIAVVALLTGCGSVKDYEIRQGAGGPVIAGSDGTASPFLPPNSPEFRLKANIGLLDGVTNVKLRYRIGTGTALTIPKSQLNGTSNGTDRSYRFNAPANAYAGQDIFSRWTVSFQSRTVVKDLSATTAGTILAQELEVVSIDIQDAGGVSLSNQNQWPGDESLRIFATIRNNGGGYSPVFIKGNFINLGTPSPIDDISMTYPAGLGSGAEATIEIGAITTPNSSSFISGTLIVEFDDNAGDTEASNDYKNLELVIVPPS